MKRYVIVLLGTLLLLAVVAPAAYADGGPHGGYQDVSAGLPDQCAACHRVHQGQSTGKLLKAESPYALCLTCHNGAGSRLDVLDGVKLGATQSPDAAVVRSADTADINASVAPTTLFYAPIKTDMGGAVADDGGVQTDQTTASINPTANDMTLLPTLPAVADAYYFGGSSKFSVVNLNVGTAGAGTWTITWKYYDGTTWTALTGVADGTTGFTVAGVQEVSFQLPSNWAMTTIQSKQLYWVRAEVTAFTAVTTPPTGTQAWVGGFPQHITVAVRNRTAGVAAVTLSIVSDSNTTNFNSSVLAATALSVPAAVGDIPGVAYTTLTTRSKASAVANDSNLTTVRATFNALNADVKVQTRVGNPAGLGALNGGGFQYIAGVAITSRHNADPADNSLYPWGYNANTGQNTNALSSPLQCTSCHNPHGTANYRLLKEKVNTQTVVVRAYYSSAFTKDEGGAGIVTTPADKYTQEYYGSAGTGGAPTTAAQGSIASLCGACHTAYPSTGASVAYTAGSVTHYRHKTEMPYTAWTNPETGLPVTNNPESSPLSGFPALRLASSSTETNTIVTCLTCHRVHGSTSNMSGYALMKTFGGLGDNDLTPSQTAASISTLLYTNNRGMCEACHQW
ncbi:MAG: cytochrome c3 family protein [Chloroflexi bacterium]|nr:cytochrome c3 family protein [Chloroflexota bacterium]